MASLGELYQFLSVPQKLLLSLCACFGLGAGTAMPLMMLTFKSMFETLGAATAFDGASLNADKIRFVVWFMLGVVGPIYGGCTVLYFMPVEYLGHATLFHYKSNYLKAVLRQDVGWYDTSNPEELASKFAAAMVKLQKGVGGMTFMMFEGLGYGLGSFIMAFYYQWEVTLITLSTIWLLVIPAGWMMYTINTKQKVLSKAYGKAGGIATEALFSMRTVAAFGVEEKFEQRYTKAVSGASHASTMNSLVMGVNIGCIFSAYLFMMVAAVAYGGLQLAGEMERSQFNFIVPSDTQGLSSPYSQALALTSAASYRFCATANNTPTSVDYTACVAPSVTYKMNCLVAGMVVQLAETRPPDTLEDGSAAFNRTIEAMGFESVSSFGTYVSSTAPSEYTYKTNTWGTAEASDGGCSYAGTYILIAILLTMMAGEGLSMAGAPWEHIMSARQAAAEILAIVNRVPTIDSFSDAGQKLSSVSGQIEVKDVTFAYPAAPEHNVCKGYSLTIPAGQTVALCGPSGSGKSTIIQLIERFYDPQSGMVLLDGTDIKTLNVKWLRSQLGLVGQEPVLFRGTVAQNIAHGKPGASQSEIEDAAKKANAHSFIMDNLSDKYETEVGQGGSKLSGGQKQRVAIARAIIKQPSVLLLDEATSALDNESEKVVQAALDKIMNEGQMTTVVIAHRLSTIRNADKIAVVYEGTISEEGTHDQLLSNQGLYASLVMSS